MEDWHGAPSSLPRGLAPHGAHCAAKCPKWYPREDHACLQWQCRAVAMHGAQLCAESTVYTGKASMREQGRIGAAANALRAAAGRAGVWPAGRRLPSQPRQQPCTHPSAGRRRKRGLPRCSPGTGRTRAFRFKMHAWNRGTERGKVEIDAIFLRSTRAVMPPKSGSRTLRCTSKKKSLGGKRVGERLREAAPAAAAAAAGRHGWDAGVRPAAAGMAWQRGQDV